MAEQREGPDTYRLSDRADESTAKLRLYMEANRRLAAVGLFAAILVVLTVIAYGAPGAAGVARSTTTISTLFQALVTATITGVTLVLTLNQLVISQELGAAGDQRGRMQNALAFRDDASDALDLQVAPAQPSRFLRAFVRRLDDCAGDLRSAVEAGTATGAGTRDADLQDDVETFADVVDAETGPVSEALSDAQFGEFSVLSAALELDYSRQLFAARRIREQHGEAMGSEALATLDDVVDLLGLYGVAREHFKTLYFQWTLINLSRDILWAALPALVVSASMVVFFDPAAVPRRVLGVDPVPALVAAAIAVSVLPFVVLMSYVLRVATVTKYTLSIGPFLLRSTGRAEEVDLE